MTVYLVKNFLEGQQSEYYVGSQEEADENYSTQITCVIGTKEEAQLRQQEIAAEYLRIESYRFSVNKEIQSGENAVWTTVSDLNSETHEGAFQVFNAVAGSYSRANNKEEALALLEKVKNDFIVFSGLSDVMEIEKLPVDYSEDTYGVNTGTIPVEVL
jgi:hypothetical protein